MRKYIGAVSSALMGILTFVFLSLNQMVTKLSAGDYSSEGSSSNAWDIIKTEPVIEQDGYTLYKVFTIIAIVLACLLIISAVVMILRNLKVLKFKFSMNLINNILLILFLVCAIVAFVGLVQMCGTAGALGVEVSTTPAVGAYLLLGFAVVLTLVSLLFSKKAK